MYELKNGILYRDGRACFALGQSYYPSYHPQKVPVPEDGDRLGEMKRDLRAMRDAGFTLVRLAAIGDAALDDAGGLRLDFPLPDAILREADALGMASMVRLQGYSIDLHGCDNATMLDQDGREMPFYWSWFVRNCLNHAGIQADNELVTRESAHWFAQYQSLVGFQIYNEAAYPTQGFYDYNPESIAAYRRWLTATGRMSAAEAEAHEPPRRRPAPGESPRDWVNFRLFHTERMSGFLNRLSDVAKEAYGGAETLTCHMYCPCQPGTAVRGEDYFDIADGMDIVGITHYVPAKGTDYYNASLVLDAAESAAATFGKHAWLIEYNARTACPLAEWERETYNAVGAGFKGIIYYQWRADYPFPDSPEPEGFGMVWNDGRKTEKYDGAVAMTRQLASLAPYIAESEKLRSGIGILFSKHANAWFDALDGGDELDCHKVKNRCVTWLCRLYTQLKQRGFVPDLARAEDLGENPLGVQLLLLPTWEGLSDQEQADVRRYAERAPVFCYLPETDGFRPIAGLCTDRPLALDAERGYRLDGLLSRLGAAPAARAVCAAGSLACGVLAGQNEFGRHYLISLVNYDDFERPVEGARLFLDENLAARTEHALFLTPRERAELSVECSDGEYSFALPTVTTGGYVVLYNGEFQTLSFAEESIPL